MMWREQGLAGPTPSSPSSFGGPAASSTPRAASALPSVSIMSPTNVVDGSGLFRKSFTLMQGRSLSLKAKLGSSLSRFSVKRRDDER